MIRTFFVGETTGLLRRFGNEREHNTYRCGMDNETCGVIGEINGLIRKCGNRTHSLVLRQGVSPFLHKGRCQDVAKFTLSLGIEKQSSMNVSNRLHVQIGTGYT